MFFVVLRYVQFLLSLVYPVAIIIILFLAWQDWHRYVNLHLKEYKEDKELKEKVQEFIE